MPTIKQLAANEAKEKRFRGGHSLCSGCGIPIVVRTVLNSIETPVVVVNATGCLEVATTRFPNTAWNVPWLHVAFENAAAAASGVESAYRALVKRGKLPADEPVTFVVFGGDGGTYDIGLQSLSGALERGHQFLYVCYDNEAYMNTGIQRSSATPFGASTTTSPEGKISFGKAQQRKDLTAIAEAHHVNYVGQSAISHWHDLSDKVKRAVEVDGPAFINVLSTCQLGWRHEPREAVKVAQLAVDTLFWPLYEVVKGRFRLTHIPEEIVPIETWLRMQGRFKHLFKEENAGALEVIQQQIFDEWERLKERDRNDRAHFAPLQKDQTFTTEFEMV
ncbi:thiamine pyrophosphate-dependent enzyme [Gracilimonas mengyeensis]|uniref:Pyruvate ferredoxin oxidoreductase beta subunit n=1 Tax=Gracilimonas mengyeensis TaxID=1302730 RepID=A0A521CIX2_9BACT|nr:thiamine pyrophosphate-dependent enzyme [Gracilimonas mengyeensis]SMO59396.1 pyruvate ferredoxin oxidoreductase beta subunit [Gracilimonas mengyeensis]